MACLKERKNLGKFATVETRCHSLHGQHYVPFQENKDTIQNLLTELGLKEGETFLDYRDTCRKQALCPVFEIPTQNGKLWPVVVIKQQRLLFCALPLLKSPVTDDAYPPLVNLTCVSLAFEVLLAVARCVASIHGNLTPGSQSEEELNRFLASSLPFGRPVCTDALTAKLLCDPKVNQAKSGNKPPLWKPIPYKGKPQVNVQVQEKVRAVQYNRPECQDVIEVFGTVICTAEVEDSLSEISLAISNLNVQDIVTSPHVTSMEKEKTGSAGCSVRLRFHSPPSSFVLCHYKVPSVVELPIYGSFKARHSDKSATLLLQLQLNHRVKNMFQYLAVLVPFHCNRCVKRIENDCTLGSAAISQDKSSLVWLLGNKFPSRNLEASLNATVYFDPELKRQSSDNPFCKGNNMYAEVCFIIQDYTQSGCSVDDKTVHATKVAKMKCIINQKYTSKQYRIWNSHGDVPAMY